MNNPTFSIVTISHNSIATIQRTFESILDQQYKNIQYIVVDGASNDGTCDVIKKYEKKMKENDISFLWTSEPDNGISDAFNKGIKRASGDFLSFLNSDDWYEPNTLKSVCLAETEKQYDYYFGNIYMHLGQSVDILYGREFSDFKAKYVMPIMHPSLFVSKNVYSNCGFFDTKYKRAMDYDYFLRIIEKGYKGKYLKSLFVNMQDGGAHRTDYMKTLREVEDISKKHGGNAFLAFWAREYTYSNQCGKGIPVINYLRKIKKP